MRKNRITIEEWLSGALSDTEKGGPCTAIALVHMRPNGVGQEEVYAKQMVGTNGEIQTVKVSDLASKITSSAVYFVQDIPGIQTFKILAFYNGGSEPRASHTFTVADGDLTAGDIPYSRFEANERGLLGQLMKHNQDMMNMLSGIVQTTAVQSVLREKELRQDLREAEMIVRDVLLTMRKDAHQMKMEELQFQRQTQERAQLGRALPSIVNGLANREVFSENTADTELIDAISLKITPDHVNMLMTMGLLDKQQATILLARIAKTKERIRAEQEALRVLPPEDSEKKGGDGNGSVPPSLPH